MLNKYCVKLGGVIAALMMLAPLFILSSYDNFEDIYVFLFWFIISILYDFYMYSIIKKDNYLEDKKNLFFDVLNGKLFESKTEEGKMLWYKEICMDMFLNYFNEDKK